VAAGKRARTDGLVQRSELPKAKGATATNPVPAEVRARVGATFMHGATKYQYEITSGGGFKIIASPNGKGKGIEFTHNGEHAEAWKVLSAYVIEAAKNGTIPPTVKTAEPVAPVVHDDAKKPAEDPWSFGGLLESAASGLSELVDSGLALLSGGLDIIEGAIDRAIGGSGGGTGAEKVGGDTHEVDPTKDVAKTPDKKAPIDAGPSEPATIEDMPKMSQFCWYGTSFEVLGVDEVFAAAKLIGDTYSFGGTVTKVTEPEDSVKKKNPNQGYWWFKADGTPAWDGNKCGGTQYVTFTIADGETSSKVNPVSAYLAENAPGKRPAKLHIGGKDTDVPDDVQNLALRNIPGPRSCFATSAAMMAQAGVHAGGSDLGSGILPITGESYRDYTDDEKAKYTSKDGTLDEAKMHSSIHREVSGVTVDADAAAKAKAYIDFEVDHGRPVFTGITYKESTLNSDGRTDHWVVISGRSGANTYTFNDPGVSATKDVAKAANIFVWDGEKLHKPLPDPTHLYVVAWIRPNLESAKAWAEHWAKVQSGGDTKVEPKAG
jgi:hypothetical protein